MSELADERTGWLAELLCARLCHDLAGAAGAVTAGAELLVEEGGGSPMAAEALDLMASSAISLSVRLRFLRLALSPANQSAAGQARTLALAYFSKGFPQGNWRLDWPAEQPVLPSGEVAKLLLNLISVAQECLPRGGVITVRTGAALIVAAEGSAAMIGEAASGLHAAGWRDLTPRAAQGAYAALLVRQLGAELHVEPSEQAVQISVKLKSFI